MKRSRHSLVQAVAMKKVDHRQMRFLGPLALLFLASSCIYVRVRGDLSEGHWLDEVVEDVSYTPAGFQRGETNLQISGFLWDTEGKLEMNFACDPDELEAYLDSVGASVEREIEERDCEVTSIVRGDDRRLTYGYGGHDRDGRVTVEIVEQSGNERHPYRLVMTWDEDE